MLVLAGDIMAVGANVNSASALRPRLFDKNFSWQALVEFASDHDVLPALTWALKQRSLLLPVPRILSGAAAEAHVTNRLETAYGQHLDRQNDLRNQVIAVVAALNACGIVPCLIKGARHLVDELFRSWSQARAMRDIDILVKSDATGPAIDALHAAGYRFDAQGMAVSYHHVPEMRREGNFGAIELHTNALAFAAEKLFPTADVWAVAEAGKHAGLQYFVLPPEWHLLQGLLHHQVSDRGHVRRILALKGLWEFAMQGSEISRAGWQRIAAHTERCGCADVLGSWVAQAHRLFGLPVPDANLISPAARRHADQTFERAFAPYGLRRCYFIADQLRFAFRRETLVHRYQISNEGFGAATRLKHVAFLIRKYRGNSLRRLFGRNRPS